MNQLEKDLSYWNGFAECMKVVQDNGTCKATELARQGIEDVKKQIAAAIAANTQEKRNE